MAVSFKAIDVCREVLQDHIFKLKHQEYISPECEVIKYNLLRKYQEALNEVESVYQDYKNGKIGDH